MQTELEIYADDVKCSHGSTSGNMDVGSIYCLLEDYRRGNFITNEAFV